MLVPVYAGPGGVFCELELAATNISIGATPQDTQGTGGLLFPSGCLKGLATKKVFESV